MEPVQPPGDDPAGIVEPKSERTVGQEDPYDLRLVLLISGKVLRGPLWASRRAMLRRSSRRHHAKALGVIRH